MRTWKVSEVANKKIKFIQPAVFPYQSFNKTVDEHVVRHTCMYWVLIELRI